MFASRTFAKRRDGAPRLSPRRALIEDDSARSRSTTLAYLRIGYKISPCVRVVLDVFNLFDRRASDIDYFYASVEPRRFRAGVAASL